MRTRIGSALQRKRRKTIGAHHGHNHNHSHTEKAENRSSKLKIALVLTAVYMIAEAVGGWWTNSLALIADAGHMLTDVAALGLTLTAIWFVSCPATPTKTFGYYRLEILAAFINGVILAVISLWVIYEAYERFYAPPEINSFGLMFIAVGGLIINLIAAYLLHGDHENDLNMHGAWLHVIGDALGSLAAIVAGALIYAFGWIWADAATSFLISLIIIFGAWRLIRESVNVLLEGTPSHINLVAVEEEILETEGVQGVHDLHVWTISSGLEALSAHVRHTDETAQAELLKVLRAKLNDRFGINHLTIQMETREFEDETFHFCETGAQCFEPRIKTNIVNN